MGSKQSPSEFDLYLKRINEFDLLSLEDELKLSKQYQRGDPLAGQTIVNANLRFVVKISKAYYYHGHNPLEIIQEGNLGLLKALTMFDPDRGVKFICYAVWWVRAYIRNFIYKNTRPHNGMLGHASRLFSLDTVLSERDGCEECFIDHLPDDGPGQEESYFSKQKDGLILQSLYSQTCPLSSREIYILEKRFFAEPRETLEVLARKLNITRERVRQIQARSLKKMKEFIENQHTVVSEDFSPSRNDATAGRRVFASM